MVEHRIVARLPDDRIHLTCSFLHLPAHPVARVERSAIGRVRGSTRCGRLLGFFPGRDVGLGRRRKHLPVFGVAEHLRLLLLFLQTSPAKPLADIGGADKHRLPGFPIGHNGVPRAEACARMPLLILVQVEFHRQTLEAVPVAQAGENLDVGVVQHTTDEAARPLVQDHDALAELAALGQHDAQILRALTARGVAALSGEQAVRLFDQKQMQTLLPLLAHRVECVLDVSDQLRQQKSHDEGDTGGVAQRPQFDDRRLPQHTLEEPRVRLADVKDMAQVLVEGIDADRRAAFEDTGRLAGAFVAGQNVLFQFVVHRIRKIGQAGKDIGFVSFVVQTPGVAFTQILLAHIEPLHGAFEHGREGVRHGVGRLEARHKPGDMAADSHAGRDTEGIEAQRTALVVAYGVNNEILLQRRLMVFRGLFALRVQRGAQQQAVLLPGRGVQDQEGHLVVAPELEQDIERHVALAASRRSHEQRGHHQALERHAECLCLLSDIARRKQRLALIEVAGANLPLARIETARIENLGRNHERCFGGAERRCPAGLVRDGKVKQAGGLFGGRQKAQIGAVPAFRPFVPAPAGLSHPVEMTQRGAAVGHRRLRADDLRPYPAHRDILGRRRRGGEGRAHALHEVVRHFVLGSDQYTHDKKLIRVLQQAVVGMLTALDVGDSRGARHSRLRFYTHALFAKRTGLCILNLDIRFRGQAGKVFVDQPEPPAGGREIFQSIRLLDPRGNDLHTNGNRFGRVREVLDEHQPGIHLGIRPEPMRHVLDILGMCAAVPDLAFLMLAQFDHIHVRNRVRQEHRAAQGGFREPERSAVGEKSLLGEVVERMLPCTRRRRGGQRGGLFRRAAEHDHAHLRTHRRTLGMSHQLQRDGDAIFRAVQFACIALEAIENLLNEGLRRLGVTGRRDGERRNPEPGHAIKHRSGNLRFLHARHSFRHGRHDMTIVGQRRAGQNEGRRFAGHGKSPDAG